MPQATYPLLPNPLDVPDLPAGYAATVPTTRDLPALEDLILQARAARGRRAQLDRSFLTARVTGTGSWTRTQIIVRAASAGDPAGRGPILAWACVHDRAAGRTDLELVITPDRTGDELATALLTWSRGVAARVARGRGVATTQMHVDIDEADTELARRLNSDGYELVRTWLEMTRPVVPATDLNPPEPREGVRVRTVATHEDGMPVAQDVQVVHRMLEESFADHFNSYRESFSEFTQRLREAPGHRWDHWWIAEVRDPREPDRPVLADRPGGLWRAGGSLVSSVLPAAGIGDEGSYIDYLGVHRSARGRGVAKALLRAVLRDAAARGRSIVNLEVDADSPTHADGIYRSMGWTVDHRTQSWHSAQAAAD